ncbi:hypothetical protein BTVI_154683 [Pitangus sulphuratus]|nr:hypothetical protein BTVI_154683 [Pitangus sulphuratus]
MPASSRMDFLPRLSQSRVTVTPPCNIFKNRKLLLSEEFQPGKSRVRTWEQCRHQVYGWLDWTELQWDIVLIQYDGVSLTCFHVDGDLADKRPDFVLLDHFSQL